jgi:hypothetical protein
LITSTSAQLVEERTPSRSTRPALYLPSRLDVDGLGHGRRAVPKDIPMFSIGTMRGAPCARGSLCGRACGPSHGTPHHDATKCTRGPMWSGGEPVVYGHRGVGYCAAVGSLTRAELDAMVAEATVDAYGDYEQLGASTR